MVCVLFNCSEVSNIPVVGDMAMSSIRYCATLPLLCVVVATSYMGDMTPVIDCTGYAGLLHKC